MQSPTSILRNLVGGTTMRTTDDCCKKGKVRRRVDLDSATSLAWKSQVYASDGPTTPRTSKRPRRYRVQKRKKFAIDTHKCKKNLVDQVPWSWLRREDQIPVTISFPRLSTKTQSSASGINLGSCLTLDSINFNVKTRGIRGSQVHPPIRFVNTSRTPANTRTLVVTNYEFIPGKVDIRMEASRKPTLTVPLINDADSTVSTKSIIPTLYFNGCVGETFKEIVSLQAVIPPRTMVHVMQLVDDKKKAHRTRMSTEEWLGVSVIDKWRWGPVNQGNKDSLYKWCFPVAGSFPVACLQGFDGPQTHFGDFRFSVDLDVPVGTPLLCPRDGIVVDLKDDSDLVGACPEFEGHANYLSIVHEDGSCSEMLHLRHKGVKVHLGEFVRRGQIIGESGNTGYSSGPHLHFHVREHADVSGKTIPFRFDNLTEEGFILSTGQAFNPDKNEISSI